MKKSFIPLFISIFFIACENTDWESINGSPEEILGKEKYEQLLQEITFGEEYSKGTVVVFRDKKYGLLGPTGKVILEYEYDLISALNGDLRLIKKDDKFGFCDYRGKIISDCVYDDVGAIEGTHIKVEKNGKWGFLNLNGEEEIPLIYESISEYNDSLFVARKNGKVGISDYNANALVDYKWDGIKLRLFGNATYAIDGEQFAIFNSSLKQVTEPSFIPDNMFFWAHDTEGYACVISSATLKWGVVEVETGRNVVPFEYDDLGYVSEGVVRAEKNGKHGFIDMTGEIIIPFIYDDAKDFSEGLAMVGKSYAKHPYIDLYFNHYGFINKKGEVVIPLTFADQSLVMGGEFHYGLAVMGKKRPDNHFAGDKGYIDKTGKFVIAPIYKDADDFELGVAIVKNHDGKYGVIDTLGNTLIPLSFDAASINKEDSTIVMKKKKDDQDILSFNAQYIYNLKGEMIK